MVIILLAIFAIFFWKARISKRSPPIGEMAEPKKEKPAKLAKVVFRSQLAGRWYPADTKTLSKQIESFFQKAEVKPINNFIAFIDQDDLWMSEKLEKQLPLFDDPEVSLVYCDAIIFNTDASFCVF